MSLPQLSYVFHVWLLVSGTRMIYIQHSSIYMSRSVFSFFCQIRKKNVLKDFVTIAGPLGVTHFMIFSKTQSTINMVGSDAGKQNMIVILL